MILMIWSEYWKCLLILEHGKIDFALQKEEDKIVGS